jgi:plastocyanin
MATWVNDEPGDHTVTVFQDGQLIADSGVLAAGQFSPHRFDEPGAGMGGMGTPASGT